MPASLDEVFAEILEIRRLLKKKDAPFLNLREAAKYLGLAPATIYQFTSQKRLPHYKMGGRRLYFKKSDLDDFILNEDRRVNSKAEIETKATNEALLNKRRRK